MAFKLCIYVLGLLWAAASSAFSKEFVFETPQIRFSVADNGVVSGFLEKDSLQGLSGSTALPLAAVKKGEQVFPATEVRDEGGSLFRLVFGQSGVEAEYRITSHKDYLVFELIHLERPDVQQVTLLQVGTRTFANAGSLINARWDDRFTVCLMSLDHRVEARLGAGNTLTSSVYPEFGMEGTKVALIAVPTKMFLETVQKVEQDFGLPSPTIDGQWAKTSDGGRASYLFVNLTEDNADELIDYAKLGGFKYILIYSSTWAQSLGSYPINTRTYPHGEDGLKATIAKCHAAGLRVGMHMLTSLVTQNDSLVSPIPSPWLLKKPLGRLAADLPALSTELATDVAGTAAKDGATDVQIDNEIIRLSVPLNPPSAVLKCHRGVAGTTAAFHTRGAQIFQLVMVEGNSYLTDVKTPIKDQIADRIAGLVNRCGFDMIYFDGGELNSATGPFWYWGSEQQASVLAKTRRDLRVQGSGFNHWSWHMWTRGTCDDYAAVGTKEYLDYHKIGESWRGYRADFMPAELGWLGLLTDAPDHSATSPDEMELYAVRALALDSPISLETTIEQMRGNGRVREMFRNLGEYERLRIERRVPEDIRNRMTEGEWHLARRNNEIIFSPVRYDSSRLSVPGDLVVKNVPRSQPLNFRLEALPAIADAGDPSNLIVGWSLMPMVLTAPGAQAPMPGALAGHIDLSAQPLDLRQHRALAVTLDVDQDSATSPSPVLNVQLEASGGSLRDYYIDLGFGGARTVIVPESTSGHMLSEFRPAYANYPIKAALRAFNYGSITGVSFRWMRLSGNRSARCRVLKVEALTEGDLELRNPRISMGHAAMSVLTSLRLGDYADVWGDAPVRIFDRAGVLLRTFPPRAPGLQLAPNENHSRIEAEGPRPAKVTAIVLGEPIPVPR